MEISSGIIGGSLEKRIIGTNFIDDAAILHLTILLQCMRSLAAPSGREARSGRHRETSCKRSARLVASVARFDKPRAPRHSNLGRKRCVHANPPAVGKKLSRLTMQLQTFSQFYCVLCKWILVFGWNNCKNNRAK